MTLYATVEFTGVVFLENRETGKSVPLQLALADEFRMQDYPVEMFCGRLTVKFPFGRFYLSAMELAEVE